MNVIEDIFRGKYHPLDIKPASAEFRAADALAFEMSRKLEESFSDEQRAWWNEFISNNMIAQELYSLEYYRQGVIFGASLMTEVLDGTLRQPPEIKPEETHE